MLKKEILYGITTLILISIAAKPSKFEEGKTAALDTFNAFQNMFVSCATSPMPKERFWADDLKSFVNYPSKTTVGLAPKFISNRKFFANMLITPGFKLMLAKDEEDLRKDLIKKLKYCDQVIMDEKLLLEFFDREVDQSKI